MFLKINKKKRLSKTCIKIVILMKYPPALLFTLLLAVGKRIVKHYLKKNIYPKNSSTTIGMLFGALTSILSVAPFYFSASGIVMAIVNFGIVIGLAWYKYMNAITYVQDEHWWGN